MKLLALIPARGGSKRLPGKNLMPLGGVPMIAWSIRRACASGCFTDVLVSTDDPAIATVAKVSGASVPWLRPAELSTDNSTSVEVALHALEAWEGANGSADGLMLLQPTSPFRSVESIRLAVNLFHCNEGQHPLVSVSPAISHPAWCFSVTPRGMQPFLGWERLGALSEDLEPAWVLNGAIYLITPQRLREAGSFLTPDTQPVLMEDIAESIDVDTPEDFARCVALVRAGLRPIA